MFHTLHPLSFHVPIVPHNQDHAYCSHLVCRDLLVQFTDGIVILSQEWSKHPAKIHVHY